MDIFGQNDILSNILMLTPYQSMMQIIVDLSSSSRKLNHIVQKIISDLSFWVERAKLNYGIDFTKFKFDKDITIRIIKYVEEKFSYYDYGALLSLSCVYNMQDLFNISIIQSTSECLRASAQVCIEYGRIEMCSDILDLNKFNVNERNAEIIISAVSSGSADMAKMMLDKDNIDPRTQNNTESGMDCIISIACERGNLEIVKAIMEDGRVDVSNYDYDAISAAIENNNLDVTKYLLDNQISRQGFDQDSIHVAQSPEMIDLILSNIPTPKEYLDAAFRFNMRRGRIDMCYAINKYY
jgi:hypothetical protein